ncbi:sugar transporter SWEET1-like isoform X1 [Montipora foliosa]|uniref:sugar transporter SWEET1-like isoform X1 n=1 Tax=Montipora foliosa TaxID=591990 RepID=UPI0035F1508C
MGIKAVVSAIGILSQFGLLSTGIPVCLKIRQQGSTKNVTFFPFLTTCLSSILWTKYGILTDDMAVYVVGILGTVWQSVYLLFYYFYTRKKALQEIYSRCLNQLTPHQKLLSLRLVMAFLGVCAILTYIKYYSGDHDTAVYHLGYVASGFSIAVYGSPLISVTNVIKYKSTEFMTFSMCLATFVVSFLWTIYGFLEGDNFILVPNGIGVVLGSMQLFLFILYPKTSQKSILYDSSSRLDKPV